MMKYVYIITMGILLLCIAWVGSKVSHLSLPFTISMISLGMSCTTCYISLTKDNDEGEDI